MTDKTVFVVPYFHNNRIGYTMHYSERKAKEWGFRRKAKTEENFMILRMSELEALKLR